MQKIENKTICVLSSSICKEQVYIMKISMLFLVVALFMSMVLHIHGVSQSEAQAVFDDVDDYFRFRTIHTPSVPASRGPTRFQRLHEKALVNLPQMSHSSASSACPSNNALRDYQDNIRKINMLQEARLRAFWELQADYPTCVYMWEQITLGNYNVLPYIAPNISGAAHPADWMASGPMTMPNGMVMESGMANLVGYSHGTYCAIHPEKQLAPGYVQAVYINQVVCEGGFCHFDVTTQTATFEIVYGNITIPSFVANLTTVGYMTFDSQNRINSLQADVRFIDRLSFIDPSFNTPFTTTRNDAINGNCYLATSLLCTTPGTSQFAPSPYDPVGSPGLIDCITYMQTLPTGDLGIAYGRNVQCKNTHTLLAADVPTMHCGHVGKSGAGQCRNRFIPGEGLNALGEIDATQAFDPYGIPYGPGYVEAYSTMLQKRAYDPRNTAKEACLNARAMVV
jgi:hypothetical protein